MSADISAGEDDFNLDDGLSLSEAGSEDDELLHGDHGFVDHVASAKLSNWLVNLRPDKLEYAVYSGHECLVFFHAESLLLDFLQAHEGLRSREGRYARPPSPLYLIYQIERFLQSILDCCPYWKIEILFLESFNQEYVPNFGFYREILRKHCEHAGPEKLPYSVYASPQSPQLNERLKTVDRVIMRFSEPQRSAEDEEDEEEDEEEDTRQEDFLSLCVHFLRKSVLVGLLNGYEIIAMRLYCYTFDPMVYPPESLPPLKHLDSMGNLRDEFAEEDYVAPELKAATRTQVKLEVVNAFLQDNLPALGEETSIERTLTMLGCKVFVMVDYYQDRWENRMVEELEDFNEDTVQVLNFLNCVQENLLRKAEEFLVDKQGAFHDFCDIRLSHYLFGLLLKESMSQDWANVGVEAEDAADLQALWETAIRELPGLSASEAALSPFIFSPLKDWEDCQDFEFPESRPQTTLTLAKMGTLNASDEFEENPFWRDFYQAAQVDPQKFASLESFSAPHTNLTAVPKMKEVPSQVFPIVHNLLDRFETGKIQAEADMSKSFLARGMNLEKAQKRLAIKRSRDNQVQSNMLYLYAQSLGNNFLHNPIVTTIEREVKAAEVLKLTGKNKPKQVHQKPVKAGKNPPAKIKSKAELILDQQNEAKAKKLKADDKAVIEDMENRLLPKLEKMEADKLDGALLDFFAGFNRVLDHVGGLSDLKRLLHAPESQCKLAFKVLKAVNKSIKAWDLPKIEAFPLRRLCVRLMTICQELWLEYQGIMDVKEMKVFQSTLLRAGFPKVLKHYFKLWAQEDPEKLGSKEDAKKHPPILYEVAQLGEKTFQFMYMGEYMIRDTGMKPDPKKRINFQPDAWQLQLLDIVDDWESALVCAPTSAGKTFISYYTMDKVLRLDDHSIVAYVCPNKQLVNQSVADIMSRFSSKTFPEENSTLYGLLTGEYADKTFNCQVITITPDMFERLLLDPSERSQLLISRLKYVIMDEVHCIDDLRGGSVWQNLIKLVPCPFVALSATIGEPEEFAKWVKSVTKTKLHFIKVEQRYSGLTNYRYSSKHGIIPWHPCSFYKVQDIRKSPIAIPFNPRETCQLYLALKQVKKHYKLDLDLSTIDLEKNALFQQGFIVKKNFSEYEKLMKTLLFQLAAEFSEDHWEFIRDILTKQCPVNIQAAFTDMDPRKAVDVLAPDEEEPEEDTLEAPQNSRLPEHMQPKKLFKFCRTIMNNGMTPSLCFNLNVSQLIPMVSQIVEYMETQQTLKYFGDEDRAAEYRRAFRIKQLEYERALKQYETLQKISKKDDTQRDGHALPDMPIPPVDPSEQIDDLYSFVNKRAYYRDRADIDEIIEKLPKVDKVLVAGLRRGIGIHYDEGKTKYKQAVEVLFRKGYLSFVFSTSTLAMGINMPCKSVVFPGSFGISTLSMHQMAGRAGRRGYDLVGHVLFWGWDPKAVSQIVREKLTHIRGKKTTSVVQAVRSANLYYSQGDVNEKDPKALKERDPRKVLAFDKWNPLACGGSSSALMEKLLFFLTQDLIRDKREDHLRIYQAKVLLRVQLEFLAREGFLSRQGLPAGFFQLLATCWQDTPGIFYVHRLIVSGKLEAYLETMMSEYSEEKVENAKKSSGTSGVSFSSFLLMSVLSHVLHRVEIMRKPFVKFPDQHFGQLSPIEKIHQLFTISPFLPKLPEELAGEIGSYNQQCSQIFTNAFKVVSQPGPGTPLEFQTYLPSDFELPLSQKSVGTTSKPCATLQPLSHQDYSLSPFALMEASRISDPYFMIQSLKREFSASAGMFPMYIRADRGYAEDAQLPNPYDVVIDSHSQYMEAEDDQETGDQEPCFVFTNSWAVDMLRHGKLQLLIKQNNLPRNRVWSMVQDMLVTLYNLKDLMLALFPKSPLTQAFVTLATEFANAAGQKRQRKAAKRKPGSGKLREVRLE